MLDCDDSDRCAHSDMNRFHFDVSSFPPAVARHQVSLEIDNKHLQFILPFEVKVFQCYMCACININFIAFIIHVKLLRVINFVGFITHKNSLATKYFQTTVILFVFISKFTWILVKRSIFVGIILRIIRGF